MVLKWTYDDVKDFSNKVKFDYSTLQAILKGKT